MTMVPFTVTRPRPDALVPVLYDSPHSGRRYPDDWGSVQPLSALRRGEDAYVDELVAPAVDVGITILSADLPRSYIDVNRAADDVDPELVTEQGWPGAKPSEKSRMGLGLIRRLIVPGVSIYDRRLRPDEIAARLDGIYHPYHAALASELRALSEQFGQVWHIDWHSMKAEGNAMTPDGAGAVRPDFAVGDLDGASADPSFAAFVVSTLKDLGFSVGHNAPYKGAEILRRHGRPSIGIHSIQVEISRALYLDELSVTKTERFSSLRAALQTFSTRLSDHAASQRR